MEKIRSFRDLIVWQLSSELSKEIHDLVKSFPRDERFSLSDDLLRSVRSIPANIAEGWGRRFPKEKISFYNIANGSAEECSNHIIEARNIDYISEATHDRLQKKVHVVAVKLTNLISATCKRVTKPPHEISKKNLK
ncbi:MAG: four helix bundle protein [candidate division WOR-3 bacterium]|nr:four helix bundle protein [candidate division WOR-3 bacterium]